MSEDAVKQSKKFAAGKATCIDCHTGVAYKEPEEPKPPIKAADASTAARDAQRDGAGGTPPGL